MNKLILTAACALATVTAAAQQASDSFEAVSACNNTIYFAVTAEGEYLPIVWGLDTAWPHEGNMVRGIRFMGPQTLDVARVSFQPWDFVDGWELTPRLLDNLKERLRLVSLIKGEGGVQLVLNNDGPFEEIDTRYLGAATNPEAAKAYADNIYATLLACQEAGWDVITVSPLNEPDYVWNGQGSQEDFLAIAKVLKTYPQLADGSVRLSGGNTLNCDCAYDWYKFLFDYVDEGNTHQLAGDFDHYADFFTIVRNDGKYATADELHNVMEAMVGVEYGMQTGIWWGTAELARGEFCKASNGRRLAYAENRDNWTAASVYRNPQGGIQGFVGTSERQAKPDSYRFVSTDRDVFYNGYGPRREYTVNTPGGFGYQDGQTNAECVVDITWGEDVSPVIDGNYVLMNKMSEKVMAISGGTGNFAEPKQFAQASDLHMLWQVVPVPNTIGGDFSYWTIKLADATNMKLDINNFTLAEHGSIILYDGGEGDNEQWYLRYAGDGYFRIFSRYSNMCLEVSEDSNADGILILQASQSDNPRQLWRFLPEGIPCETEKPLAPTDLAATAHYASIELNWASSLSADVASYTVLRAEKGSNDYETVGRNIAGTQFTDNTIAIGKEYVYKVKAVDFACNSSDYTSEVESQAYAAEGMVMRLTMDNTIEDATLNHFHGVSEFVPRYKSGIEGSKALNLASGRYIRAPYSAFNHEVTTITAWVKINEQKADQTVFDLDCGDNQYTWLGFDSNNTLRLDVVNGEKEHHLAYADVNVNEWLHVAVVIGDGEANLYVNGILADHSACNVSYAETGVVVAIIGGCESHKGNNLRGLIQDFRVYNYGVAPEALLKVMDTTSSAISVSADKQPAAVEYYNLQGQKVENPMAGVYIKRTVYADGTSSVQKIVK